MTPGELHYLFSVFRACAIAAAVILNFRRPIEPRSLVVFSTLLLIAIKVSYREIHGNHLIWESGWHCRVPGRQCTPLCGDHALVGDEQCDDGNRESGDGCSQTCRYETGVLCPRVDAGGSCNGGVQTLCGDGVVTPDEACDNGSDPNSSSANADHVYGGCTTACTLGPYCGDGIANGPEECDLGRFNGETTYPVLCTFACTKPHICGDGILDTDRGEVCDLGALNGQQDCAADCTFAVSSY